jgi:hypothetical protein
VDDLSLVSEEGAGHHFVAGVDLDRARLGEGEEEGEDVLGVEGRGVVGEGRREVGGG